MRINYKILSIVLILSIGFLLVNKSDSLSTEEAVLKTIYTRASVRSYTEKKIPVETLKELVKAGMAAPTAGNMQPWSFLVIDRPEIIKEMHSIHKYWKNGAGAAAVIVVLADMNTYSNRADFKPFWIADTSVATENILLAAHSMGIGAVWRSLYPAPKRTTKLREFLSIPANYEILNFISLGYPSGELHPKNKWKPEKIFMNSMSNGLE